MSINMKAPVVTRDEIVIHASPERVWAIQTDVDSWPQWQPEVDGAHLNGAFEPGSSFRWQTAGLDITSTIVATEPTRYIEWGGPVNGIVGRHVWRFEPVEGGVLVRTEESWEGEPVDAAAPAMQQALDASLAEWLGRLKSRAEAPSDEAARTDRALGRVLYAAYSVVLLVLGQFALLAAVPVAVVVVTVSRGARALRRLGYGLAAAYALPVAIWAVRPDPAPSLTKDMHPVLAALLVAAALAVAVKTHLVRRASR